ncbi:MAG: Jag N-terminal domain-containing protein, partial [Chloroflexota bacterium]|nr:Jag N-terminal domain-containing protein [Chloroflexota bacterium]
MEDAVEQALAKLGKSRDEVDIEVLSRGKSGLLGLGAEDARVRVTLRPPPSPSLPEIDVAKVAKETLELMLAAMGMDASVDAKAVPQDMAEEQSVSLALDITGEDLGILIGRRGETLTALQYLVNLMVSRRLKAHAGVMVD